MIDIWVGLIILACIMLLEMVLLVIHFCKKYPKAGNVIMDLRENSIYVESPKNITTWKKYDALRFDVVVYDPKPREF